MKLSRLFLTVVLLSGLIAPAFSQTTAPKPAPAEISDVGHLPETDDGLPGAGPIRRQDWFRKLWAQRRVAWSKRVEQDQNAVVFLGDSITQGWGDTMGNSFPGLKVANRGISGDTSRGVLIRLKEDVLALHPKAVILLIGTNDLADGADPETIASNVLLILNALREFDADMPVLLCQVFPSSETKQRPVVKIKALNELYATLVKGNPRITLVETWPLFANAEGDAKVEEFPDLLHPNKIGYAKWASALRPYFSTFGLTPAAADNFQPEPGFTSLFNGKDLTGWGYRTNQFDGKTASFDGRYSAHDGILVVHPSHEGRKIQQLWTTQEFPKNFVLKLEFRSAANADSGIFIRKPQLQCRDYLIAGPYKQLKEYKPQAWNQIEITVRDNVAFCTCNGEVLEAALKLPPTGPIGLEADRDQMEYRHIQLKELP